jgi:hypothetical protein
MRLFGEVSRPCFLLSDIDNLIQEKTIQSWKETEYSQFNSIADPTHRNLRWTDAYLDHSSALINRAFLWSALTFHNRVPPLRTTFRWHTWRDIFVHEPLRVVIVRLAELATRLGLDMVPPIVFAYASSLQFVSKNVMQSVIAKQYDRLWGEHTAHSQRDMLSIFTSSWAGALATAAIGKIPTIRATRLTMWMMKRLWWWVSEWAWHRTRT